MYVTSLCGYVWRYMCGTSLIQNMFLFQINGYDGYDEDTKEPMIIVFC